MNITTILNGLSEFFFPNLCIICKNKAENNYYGLCIDCKNKISYIYEPLCSICSKPLPDGGHFCWYCKNEKYYFEKIIAVSKYDGIMKELIHHFKYNGKEFLYEPLSCLLYSAIRKDRVFSEIDILIPVPSDKKREFRRGFNHAELLAKKVADFIGKEYSIVALKRVEVKEPQYKLSRKERLMNVRDVFCAGNTKPFQKKTVLLVDDIATTCSTLNECAKTLKNAGAKKVYCAVLARD